MHFPSPHSVQQNGLEIVVWMVNENDCGKEYMFRGEVTKEEQVFSHQKTYRSDLPWRFSDSKRPTVISHRGQIHC